MIQPLRAKVEYGDFQTPVELAEKICCKLVELGVNPDVIIEPTCGTGNFIKTSAQSFKSARKIIGIEINPNYINEIEKEYEFIQDTRIQVKQKDFFDLIGFH